MKFNILIALAFTTFINTSSAFETEVNAVVRDEKFKPTIAKVTIKDLFNLDSFEGSHFKIVEGTSDEAIKMDNEDSDLVLKAATTYYHLTKARDYFVNDLNSEYVAGIEQLTIRINIQNKFNQVGHFAHPEQDPQYNNAVTIPPGDGYAPANIAAWNTEIWFRPVKEVHVRDLNGGLGNNGQIDAIFKQFRQQTNRTNFQKFLVTALGSDTDIISALIRTAGSSVLLEIIYRFRNPINYVFSRKNYFLDAALVPEIIYHEYAHVALSDELSISVSTPVNEGMADYFASQIAESSKLASKIKEYSVFVPKKGEDDLQYNPMNESNRYANDDFTFGLLYQMNQEIGENENVPALFYEARKNFESGDKIIDGMLRGLLQACRTHCRNKFDSRLKILRVANDAGL